MEFLDILQNRRSVRQYTGEKIPKEQLEKILQAGLLSPTEKNRKPSELIVVQNKETLLALSHCRIKVAKILENAGCAILVFADTEKTDIWPEDCSIAMSNMHLMADSLGLGSCWIQGRLREAENGQTTEQFCREILAVPENFALQAILSVGILQKHPPAHTLDEINTDKVHYEKF